MRMWLWNDKMQIGKMNKLRPGTKSKPRKSSKPAFPSALPTVLSSPSQPAFPSAVSPAFPPASPSLHKNH